VYHSDTAYAAAVRSQYEKTGEALEAHVTSARLALDGCNGTLDLLKAQQEAAEAAEGSARTAAEEASTAADEALQVAHEKAAAAESAVADKAERMQAAHSAEAQAAKLKDAAATASEAVADARKAAKAKGLKAAEKARECRRLERAVERAGAEQSRADVDLRLRKAVERARRMDEASVAKYMEAGPGAPEQTSVAETVDFDNPSEHIKGMPTVEAVPALPGAETQGGA
jgi:small-conductance mechanosensitive channel